MGAEYVYNIMTLLLQITLLQGRTKALLANSYSQKGLDSHWLQNVLIMSLTQIET